MSKIKLTENEIWWLTIIAIAGMLAGRLLSEILGK